LVKLRKYKLLKALSKPGTNRVYSSSILVSSLTSTWHGTSRRKQLQIKISIIMSTLTCSGPSIGNIASACECASTRNPGSQPGVKPKLRLATLRNTQLKFKHNAQSNIMPRLRPSGSTARARGLRLKIAQKPATDLTLHNGFVPLLFNSAAHFMNS